MKISFMDRMLILFTGEYHKAVSSSIIYKLETLADNCDPGAYFDCSDLRSILLSIIKEAK